MEFRILGPLEVVADDGAIPLGGPKQRAVLAHLILRANHPVHADRLIDGLWGTSPRTRPGTRCRPTSTGSGRRSARSASAAERRLRAERRAEDEIDAARFEAIVREAKAARVGRPGGRGRAVLGRTHLWRGAPLADLANEPSLRGEVARLEELHLSAIEHRIAAEIEIGGHSTVVSELDALTARYPLRERMWANLMLALYRLGPASRGALDVPTRPRGPGRRARHGALTGAPTPPRADPPARSVARPQRTRAADRPTEPRSTCSPARRSPATGSSAPWVAAA